MSASSPVEFIMRGNRGDARRVGNMVMTPGERAAFEGNVICRWVNDITPGAAQVVLTNGPAGDQPGIYYNLDPAYMLFITQVCVELQSLNDFIEFELGYTDAVAGGGTFTPLTPQLIVYTGAAFAPFDGLQVEYKPPLPVRYTSGARSITFRVDANDAAALATLAWHGYLLRV